MINGPAVPAPKQAISGVSQHKSAGQAAHLRLCLSPGQLIGTAMVNGGRGHGVATEMHPGRHSPPKRSHEMKIRVSLVATAIAILVLGGICIADLIEGGSSKGAKSDPVAAELDRLRDPSGLFARPSAFTGHQLSIADSAYGLSLLRAAGQPVAPPSLDSALSDLTKKSVAASSVWGRWYLLRIETASGRVFPDEWQGGIMTSLMPEGFFRDSAQQGTADLAAELANTASALEVVSVKKVPLDKGQIDALTKWLDGALAEVQNPYQACNAVRALKFIGKLDGRDVGRLAQKWLGPQAGIPRTPTSFEQVLDLYGDACLAAEAPGTDMLAVRASLQLTLTHPVTDLQLLYYLAQAWTLIGGPATNLTNLATAVHGRLDVRSGLVNEIVVAQGTVESSYYVAELRKQRHSSTEDNRLVASVRTELNHHAADYGVTSLLLAAVTLRVSGNPDQVLEQKAIAAAQRQLSGPITRGNVAGWVTNQQLLAELGVAGLVSDVQPWPVDTQDDRDLAWLLVGQRQHLRDRQLPQAFAGLTQAIPGILNASAGGLTTMELRAGVEALSASGQAKFVPRQALIRELDARAGCVGLPSLYRPARGAADCDLRASADSAWLRAYLGTD
jgi:hypothetical protein